MRYGDMRAVPVATAAEEAGDFEASARAQPGAVHERISADVAAINREAALRAAADRARAKGFADGLDARDLRLAQNVASGSSYGNQTEPSTSYGQLLAAGDAAIIDRANRLLTKGSPSAGGPYVTQWNEGETRAVEQQRAVFRRYVGLNTTLGGSALGGSPIGGPMSAAAYLASGNLTVSTEAGAVASLYDGLFIPSAPRTGGSGALASIRRGGSIPLADDAVLARSEFSVARAARYPK